MFFAPVSARSQPGQSAPGGMESSAEARRYPRSSASRLKHDLFAWPGSRFRVNALNAATVRFQGAAATKTPTKTASLPWREWGRIRWNELKARLRQANESNWVWVRKQASQFLLVWAALLNGMPIPARLREAINRRFFFSPRKVSSEYLLNSSALRRVVHELRFAPRPDSLYKLTGWYIKARGNQPTVVFSHGRDSNISHLEDLLQALHDKGYGVFAYDYPGFGTSGGVPTEANLYEAGLAASHYLGNLLNIPVEKQIIMGHSLGGAVAVDVAAQLAKEGRRPQALVVVNSFTDLKSAFMESRGGFGRMFNWAIQRLFHQKKINLEFNSGQKIQNVPFPILIMHGKRDEVIRPTVGKQLYQQTRPSSDNQFVELDGTHRLKGKNCQDVVAHLETFMQRLPANAAPSA